MYNQKPLLGTLINWAHPLSKGLIGAWLFNEGSGNKIFDVSNYSNHANITGAKWDVEGLLFGSADEYAKVTSPNTPYTDQYTLSAWVKEINSGDHNYTFDQGYTNGVILSTYTDQWKYYINIGGTGYHGLFGDTTDGKFHNIIYTYNGSVCYIYLDGSEVTHLNVSGNVGGSTSDIYIGIYSGGGTYSFDGIIKTVMQNNQYTPPSQISQLYIDPYCWLARPMEAELMYAAPPVGAIMNQFQRANLGADLYDGGLII